MRETLEYSGDQRVESTLGNVRAGRLALDEPSATEDLVVRADQVQQFIDAHAGLASPASPLVLAMEVLPPVDDTVGEVSFDFQCQGIHLYSTIYGDLRLSGVVTGPAMLMGDVTGDVVVSGQIKSVGVLGDISGSLLIEGEVLWSTLVIAGGRVGGTLHVSGTAGDITVGDPDGGPTMAYFGPDPEEAEALQSQGIEAPDRFWAGDAVEEFGHAIVESGVTITGRCKDVSVCPSGFVGSHVTIAPSGQVDTLSVSGITAGGIRTWGKVVLVSVAGTVGGSVVILGSVERHLSISRGAVVHGGLLFRGSVGTDLSVWPDATIHSGATVAGDVVGSLSLEGSIEGPVGISGSVGGSSLIGTRARDPIEVVALSASLSKPLTVGEGVSLKSCDFRGFTDFDNLHLSGGTLFSEANGWLRVGECDPPLTAREQVSLYRNLRRAFELRRNRPGAGAFYYREMRARELVASEQARRQSGPLAASDWAARSEWLILRSYRALSSYGLRATKPAAWLLLSTLIFAALFVWSGLDLDTGPGIDEASALEAIQFSLQSHISFLAPPVADQSIAGRFCQIATRFAGPLLLAQAVLAVRERVAR